MEINSPIFQRKLKEKKGKEKSMKNWDIFTIMKKVEEKFSFIKLK